MKRNMVFYIWILTLIIIGFGLIALYSATYQNVRVTQKVFFDQVTGAGIGLFLLWVIGRMDYRKFFDMAYVLYGMNIIFLILVLINGRQALGASRWLELGPISFQPSEFTKFSLILLLARYFSQHRSKISFYLHGSFKILLRDMVFPFLLSALSMILIFKQPDLGTTILLFGIFCFMLFASGVAYQYIVGLIVVGLGVLPFTWHLLKPYQKDRLLVFLNPNIDPLGAGYTIIQSKIAIGSGKFFGKGWLSGTQNQLNFLPERHTDFIFSVIGEEWGLVGTLLLVCCYFLLIDYGIKIATQIKDQFGSLVAVGIVGILSLQVVINIGMVLGLFPVVGITLPLISYGRTSFIIFIIMLGILVNMSKKRTFL